MDASCEFRNRTITRTDTVVCGICGWRSFGEVPMQVKICKCTHPQITGVESSIDQRPTLSNCFREDEWTWDDEEKSAEVILYGPENRTALFHPGWSNGTAGVRGNKALNGTCSYWELEVSHRVFGTSLAFGIGTKHASLHADSFKNLIGADNNSWGFSHKGLIWHAGEQWSYSSHFKENVPTTVGVFFDGRTGILKFYKDRKDLGVAFTGLNNTSELLFPMVASTVARSEITLKTRRKLHVNLQDQCLTTLAQSLPQNVDLSSIPLPHSLREDLFSRINSISDQHNQQTSLNCI